MVRSGSNSFKNKKVEYEKIEREVGKGRGKEEVEEQREDSFNKFSKCNFIMEIKYSCQR